MAIDTGNIKEILELLNEGLSREEFVRNFKKVIDYVIAAEERIRKLTDKIVSEEGGRLDQFTKDTDITIREKLEKQLASILKQADAKLALIKHGKDGVHGRHGIDGRHGKDADEAKILTEIFKKVRIPDMSKEIAKVKKELVEEMRKNQIRGGGTSAIGIQQAMKWILKTEAPVGNIDSVNKTYSLNHTIFAIFSMSLNGEVVAQLPNYTISGKTFTFTTALPSAYSGKDWEVKYI